MDELCTIITPGCMSIWILDLERDLERQRKNTTSELDSLILQCVFDYSQTSPT